MPWWVSDFPIKYTYSVSPLVPGILPFCAFKRKPKPDSFRYVSRFFQISSFHGVSLPFETLPLRSNPHFHGLGVPGTSPPPIPRHGLRWRRCKQKTSPLRPPPGPLPDVPMNDAEAAAIAHQLAPDAKRASCFGHLREQRKWE